MSVAAGAAGVLLVAYVVLITVGITGAVCSIIGLVRGVSSRNATAVALGGIGFGCAVFGVFVFRIVLWIAGLACGAMACQLATQPHVLSFEEYKQQKAMLEDPEYAEYMRNVAAQASMQKHGSKAKQPMSGGKVGAIVLIVFAVLAVCAFAFGSAANNGTFDHLGGAPAVEQQEDVHTIEDLGDGTILFLPEHQ
ncbi:hypothetical protein [Hominenteromicrobium sp.]|uniref:hypothetical protein n=1 Tax=Hominenteromicrobium sp. TaxID=3073581 RepID=UPI003AB5DEB2